MAVTSCACTTDPSSNPAGGRTADSVGFSSPECLPRVRRYVRDNAVQPEGLREEESTLRDDLVLLPHVAQGGASPDVFIVLPSFPAEDAQIARIRIGRLDPVLSPVAAGGKSQ